MRLPRCSANFYPYDRGLDKYTPTTVSPPKPLVSYLQMDDSETESRQPIRNSIITRRVDLPGTASGAFRAVRCPFAVPGRSTRRVMMELRMGCRLSVSESSIWR